jgi:hypothetical protein
MATYNDDNYLFRDFVALNLYEIDPISKFIATVKALQYEIQIH